MRTFRDSVAKVTFPLKKHKKIRGKCPLCVSSPCGDVFLRNQILMFHMKQGGVSVPLRGCGFEMRGVTGVPSIGKREFPSPCGDVVLKCCRSPRSSEELTIVSVPLRGCGFEMRKLLCIYKIFARFRPLAGMWF